MARIFISYRRGDSAGHSGRLFDRLRAAYGDDRVFMDVTGIEAGIDFVDAIDAAVGSCDVLLAVIGPEWLSSTGSDGKRRLDDPNDFVRVEIGSALRRDVRVIPVLVDDAEMPTADALPEDIRRLARRQAVELRDKRWDADIEDLIAVIGKVLGQAGLQSAKAVPRDERPSDTPLVPDRVAENDAPGHKRRALVIGAVAVLAVLAVLGYFMADPGGGLPPTVVTARPEPSTPATPPSIPKTAPAAPESRSATTAAARRSATATPRTRAEPTPATTTPERTATRETAPPAATPTGEAERAAPARTTASRHVIVTAWGQTSYRAFWDREQPEPYTAKLLALYADTVRVALGRNDTIRRDPDRDLTRRLLQAGDPGLASAICGRYPDVLLFGAYLADSIAISQIESAYWPELRLHILDCANGEQADGKYNLAPEVGDAFPFANGIRNSTRRFLAENREMLR
jgi:hypothetical protein